MSESPVLVEDSGPVWTITINRAHKRNALDLDDRRALISALRSAESSEPCRTVILTGAGPVFSAGGDIAAMTADPAAGRVRLAVVSDLVRSIAGNAKPIIAAVEGGAFGLGLSLAAACDSIVAARDARFVASFGALGLVADGGLHWSLAQRVGAARAKELILYATELTADRAETLGLVSEVVESGTAAARAKVRAQAFLHTSAPMVAATKSIFAQGDFSLDAVLEAEMCAQLRLLNTDEFRLRQKRFLNRRRVGR
jgi:enoyl-CoA hydratase/carnithine racemase